MERAEEPVRPATGEAMAIGAALNGGRGESDRPAGERHVVLIGAYKTPGERRPSRDRDALVAEQVVADECAVDVPRDRSAGLAQERQAHEGRPLRRAGLRDARRREP